MAGRHPGGQGDRRRAAGAGGRPDPAGRPRAPGPPAQRRGHPQRRPAPGRCPVGIGPPRPGGRPAAPGGWGPAPTQRHRGSGESVGWPWGGGRRHRWMGPLAPEACRRLACDGAVTRALGSAASPPTTAPAATTPTALKSRTPPPTTIPAARTTFAATTTPPAAQPSRPGALLSPILGGAPSQPLDVGRTTRAVQPAQRLALAMRDGGCMVPGCARPLAWCEAHHRWHWLDGGPTDLALLCRAHHRAVHEGGWRLTRGPDGRLTATPSPRPPRPHRHRRHRAAA
jgi:hypothetical protein